MATLKATFKIALMATLTNALDLSDAVDPLAQNWSTTLTNGTASGMADQLWHDTRSLAATSEELDLAGSLTNGLGQTVTFVKVKVIAIKNNETATGKKLAVGGSASNAFINWVASATDIVNIGPSGLFLLSSPVDGYAVTAGTGDKLKLDAGANTVSYSIVLIGTTA